MDKIVCVGTDPQELEMSLRPPSAGFDLSRKQGAFPDEKRRFFALIF